MGKSSGPVSPIFHPESRISINLNGIFGTVIALHFAFGIGYFAGGLCYDKSFLADAFPDQAGLLIISHIL
jgi:hypothetical protein